MSNNEIDVVRDDSRLDVLPPARHPVQDVVAMLRAHHDMMEIAYQLAYKMVKTGLVPDRFRGKAEDGCAAILYGAELGLNPIQSLQRIVPIYGMPTLEARTMVALLKARGYQIRTLEQSDTQVTVEGVDLDGERYVSQWTIERAIKAKYVPEIDERTGKYKVNAKGNLIGNEKYLTDPQTMLKAKAQAEMCRDMAPDVLLGIAYSREELESENISHAPPSPAVSSGGSGAVTVEEIMAVSDEDLYAEAGAVQEDPKVEATEDNPASPAQPQPESIGDHNPDRPPEIHSGGRVGSGRSVGGGMSADKGGDRPAENGTPPPPPPRHFPATYELDPHATRGLFALLRKAGVENSPEDKLKRLAVYRFVTGRPEITTTNHLSPTELEDLREVLGKWDKQKVLQKRVDEILLAVAEDDALDNARDADAQAEKRQDDPKQGDQRC